MVPVRELGLLLCLQLCGGEQRGVGSPRGREPLEPRAGLSTLVAAGTEELRLVGGGGRCAGRVEVKHEGQWGSVCKYDFNSDTDWPTVVCRQLGCGPVARASVYAPFGQGTGRIWFHLFYCLGSENALQDCVHFGWGEPFCGHDWDIGVTCAEAVELRLAAGRGPCDGRVEVKLQGRWGSVADKPWTMENAEVVCKQLGCGSAVGAHYARNTYGEGDGPVSLAGIECRGDEAALWDCKIYGWGPYEYHHDDDIAVVCQGFSRLVGGDGACAGRLEVWQGQSWASVCQDEVDMEAARVVCQELGCGAALAVPLWSEEGAGPLWQGGFNCSGHESLLSSCARGPPRSQGCAGHAGIVCSPYTGFRLANGSSGCAGRVEVEAGGTWGSLCASGWDLRDAHVLCQHLGCGPASAVPPAGSFGVGNGTVWRDTFRCQGNERHPGECLTAALGEPACPPGHAAAVSCSALEGVEKPLRLVEGQSRCDGRLEAATGSGAWARVAEGPRDAGPVCQQLGCGELEKVQAVAGSGSAALRCGSSRDSPALCNVSASQEVAVVCSGSRRLRLAGGPGRCAGRLEVYVNGSWAGVCQDGWEQRDASVACRQLGCGAALQAAGSAAVGAGSGPLWADAGGCAGSEGSLWDCPVPAPRGCRRGGGAALVCSEQLSVRLEGGSGRCNGHLELRHNGTWGRVCAEDSSRDTATAVCRQLGCGNGGTLEAAPAQEPPLAWLAWVRCEEGARWLWRCPSAPWHLQACGPSGHAFVTCEGDGDDIGGTVTPSPGSQCPDGVTCTGEPSSSTAGTASVPTVLCGVLGALLCLALALLGCQAWARRRGSSSDTDAIPDAIYQELDYTQAPKYEEVPSGSGSPSLGSGTKLPYHSGDSVEESDPRAAPGLSRLASPVPPAHPWGPGWRGVAQPEPCHSLWVTPAHRELPALPEYGTQDGYEEMAQRSWSCGPATDPAGAPRDPREQPPGDTDYDDVGISILGTSL